MTNITTNTTTTTTTITTRMIRQRPSPRRLSTWRSLLPLLLLVLVVLRIERKNDYHCHVVLAFIIHHPPPSMFSLPPTRLPSSSSSSFSRYGTSHHRHNNKNPSIFQHDVSRMTITRTTIRMKMSFPNDVSKDSETNPLAATLFSDDNHNQHLNEELDRILTSSSSSSTSSSTSLSSPSRLRQAITFLQEHSQAISLNKSNWDHIFMTIEDLTAELAVDPNAQPPPQETSVVTTVAEFPIQSTIRQDMTDMYQLLATLPMMDTTTSISTVSNNAIATTTTPLEPTLRLFGAVSTTDPPASYISMIPNHPSPQNNNKNHIISPQLFEQILNLPMSSLTPSSSNTLLYVGIAAALIEGMLSLYTGINYNLMVGATLLFVLLDRILLNGISMETIFKVISPELQQRIYHHEAGHFLCAYLLGCPIESIVVSAYAALQDPRFRYRPSFTAGTSFFDPILSEQMNASIQPPVSSTSKTTTTTTSSGVTRSSIDRYSMIVMAGIAAEADQYGQADGGASDEYALIAFLSQLRSNQRNSNNNKNGIGTWNPEQIRNQARYGAVQAMLLLRQYRPAYEALVQALQYGGTLKDCIYAIEQAGRKHQLPTRNDRQPVGYIVNNNINTSNDDEGLTAAWIPNTHNNTFIHNLLVRK